MIRVLHYIPGYLVGGIESLYNSWYKYIDKSEFTFELLMRTTEEGAPLEWYKQQGGVYYRLPCTSITRIISFGKGVEQFFKENHDYDILHVHTSDPYVMRYAKKYGIKKIIIHSHTSRSGETLRAKINFLHEQICMRMYADKAIAVSEVAAKWKFHGMIFKGKPVEILKNGIEVDKYIFNPAVRERVRNELGIAEGQYVVGFVGRLTHQKNPFRMLRIWRCVVDKVPDAMLLIAGDGPDRAECERLISELNLEDNVRLLGFRADVNLVLNAMDAYFQPSNYEGFCITVLEAEVNGLHCVISEEVPEDARIDGMCSVVELKDDDEKWAEEIIKSKMIERNALLRADYLSYDIEACTANLQKMYGLDL